jgi:hypothetical protein
MMGGDMHDDDDDDDDDDVHDDVYDIFKKNGKNMIWIMVCDK